MSTGCVAELCPFWTGQGCACDVMGLDRPGPSFADPCTPDACCEAGQACEHHASLHGPPVEYACPECGFDGPHAVLSARVPRVVECGEAGCGAEFSPDVPVEDQPS